MLRGRLERTHSNLDAIVRCKPLGYEHWQQYLGLSELFDDLGFHGTPDGEWMPPLCRALAATTLR
jgi:hypothetical protein